MVNMLYSIMIPISTMDIIPESVTNYLFNLSTDIANDNNERLQLLDIEST